MKVELDSEVVEALMKQSQELQQLSALMPQIIEAAQGIGRHEAEIKHLGEQLEKSEPRVIRVLEGGRR